MYMYVKREKDRKKCKWAYIFYAGLSAYLQLKPVTQNYIWTINFFVFKYVYLIICNCFACL